MMVEEIIEFGSFVRKLKTENLIDEKECDTITKIMRKAEGQARWNEGLVPVERNCTDEEFNATINKCLLITERKI